MSDVEGRTCNRLGYHDKGFSPCRTCSYAKLSNFASGVLVSLFLTSVASSTPNASAWAIPRWVRWTPAATGSQQLHSNANTGWKPAQSFLSSLAVYRDRMGANDFGSAGTRRHFTIVTYRCWTRRSVTALRSNEDHESSTITALDPNKEQTERDEELKSSVGIPQTSTIGSEGQEHDPSEVTSGMDTLQAQELGQDEAADAGTVGEKGKKRKGRKMFTYDWENGPRVRWSAIKTSQVNVVEGQRKLKDYLALPPTEYSLLDPKLITRLSDDTFRMDCGTLNIVGAKISPKLTVRVDVLPEESSVNIVVEGVELEGSEAARVAGDAFNISSVTAISYAQLEDGKENELQLNTRSNVDIDILVPNENFVPLGVLRRVGCFVMQRVLDIGLPQFTKFLRRDYGRWTEGDDSRSEVTSEGESLMGDA